MPNPDVGSEDGTRPMVHISSKRRNPVRQRYLSQIPPLVVAGPSQGRLFLRFQGVPVLSFDCTGHPALAAGSDSTLKNGSKSEPAHWPPTLPGSGLDR